MGAFSGYRGIPRDALLLIASTALEILPFSYWRVLLPIYLAQINISADMIGILLAMSLIVTSIAIIPCGMLADRYGWKLFIILGTVLNGVQFLIFAVTSNLIYITLSFVTEGVADALLAAPGVALLSSVSGPEKANSAFSLNSSISTTIRTGGAALAVIPDYLGSTFHYTITQSYLPLLVLGIVMIALSTITLFPIRSKKPPPRQALKVKSFKAIGKYSIYQALTGGAFGFYGPLFTLWFYYRFHLGGEVLGPLLSITTLVVAVSFLFAPKLAQLIGSVRMISFTQLASIAFLLLMPVASSYVIVSALYLLRALAANLSAPIQSSFLMELVPPEERVFASSVAAPPFGVASALPRSATQIVTGQLLGGGEFSLPFLFSGAFYLVGGVALLVFFRRNDHPQQPNG